MEEEVSVEMAGKTMNRFVTNHKRFLGMRYIDFLLTLRLMNLPICGLALGLLLAGEYELKTWTAKNQLTQMWWPLVALIGTVTYSLFLAFFTCVYDRACLHTMPTFALMFVNGLVGMLSASCCALLLWICFSETKPPPAPGQFDNCAAWISSGYFALFGTITLFLDGYVVYVRHRCRSLRGKLEDTSVSTASEADPHVRRRRASQSSS